MTRSTESDMQDGREMVAVGMENYGILDQRLKGCFDEIFILEDDYNTNHEASLHEEEMEGNSDVALANQEQGTMAILLAKEGVEFDRREVSDTLVYSDSETEEMLVHLAKGKHVVSDS